MDQQIASYAGAIFLPATPAGEDVGIEYRSPATPVPYSFQQRQRAKMLGSNPRFGTVPCHVSQSRFCGERSGGGGYSHAPLGSLRPSEPSTIIRSPRVPCCTSSRALARSAELTRCEPI